MITLSLVAMVSIAHSEEATCTELNKCGWCMLNMLSKGQDKVSLSLMYANPSSLRESGYLARQDFPSWVAAPPEHPLRSRLPVWLRVEKVADSSVVIDERLAEMVNTFGGIGPLKRTVQSIDPGTQYTAFAYAKYEGGASQGYTHEKPFVKICFTTNSESNRCPEESTRHVKNTVTDSIAIVCDAPDAD